MSTNNVTPLIPMLAIVGFSGTGKTTLLTQLIPYLNQHHIKIGLIKHTHHNIDIDKPGKDSYQLRQAGAQQTMVVCDERWAFMSETPTNPVRLSECVTHFNPADTDLILVEGFKGETIPKIALHRQAIHYPVDELIDQYTLAIATDYIFPCAIPHLNLNHIPSIGQFIIKSLFIRGKTTPV